MKFLIPNLRSLISLLLGLLEACKRNNIITHETLIRSSEELVQKCSVCACLPGRIKIWACLSVFLGEAKTGKPGKHFLRLCRDENQPPANLCHIDAESKLNKQQLRLLFFTLLFRPIWCRTPVYTFRWPLTLQLSRPRKPTTNS